MPVLKAISGYTTTKWIARYLTHGERALAVDFCNLAEREADGRDWSRVMDDTRHDFGNDVAVRGTCRTYQHFVISLAPGERDLEKFRGLVRDWVARNLPDYQAAIVYHDDNEARAENGLEGLLHAHIVVNNTNMRTGKRISSELTKRKYTAMRADLEHLAGERGLSVIDEDRWDRQGNVERYLRPSEGHRRAPSRPVSTRSAVSARRAAAARRAPSPGLLRPGAEARIAASRHPMGAECGGVFERASRRARMTPAERAVYEKLGRTWKEDIRSVLDRALDDSASEGEFLRRVLDAGVGVDAASDGDYLFSPPGDAGHRARGCSLGDRYSRYGVRAQVRRRALERGRGAAYAGALVVGVKGSRYTVADVARMLGAVRDSGATSVAELAASGVTGAAAAADCAREIGFFALRGAPAEGTAARAARGAGKGAPLRLPKSFTEAAERGERTEAEARSHGGGARGGGSSSPAPSRSQGQAR